ncbi:hypothetical protein BD779DRAFT_1608537 [Infundibulicybe gibba]|nr:hypothetical protein BD779DRAFT_1608537 [Infundibulicybe gibba]
MDGLHQVFKPFTVPTFVHRVLELYYLIIFSLLYTLWAQSTLVSPSDVLPPSTSSPGPMSLPPPSPSNPIRPLSPRVPETRDQKRNNSTNTTLKTDFGYIWMSVPKNYRESADDGISTGLLLGPLIATALLFSCQRIGRRLRISLPPAGWRIEAPAELKNFIDPYTALEALVLSRYSLVNISTFCATILLFHVCNGRLARGERYSVPRSEALRTWYYIIFTVAVSISAVGIKLLIQQQAYGIWQNISAFEMVVISLIFQFALYIAIRLAHRGFTLGELGLVGFGGASLFMELMNITIARVTGTFLTGFLLSPFLVLSRHIAQRPVRRLRFPQEKERNRRYLALGFYIGSVLIVGGLIGMWTRWCLGKRDPWLWALFYIIEGKNRWSRPVLLAYWALLGSLSVAGWNRQLARSRRYRSRNPTTDTSTTSTLGITFSNLPNLPNLPNSANVSLVATDLLDAADKHVPTLGLNARRKFFHALAVVMFIPGVALDRGVSLFTFAEYVRYFAIYPFGAAVHLFMNEFLDRKDSGTAILSHFYLLTGCAGSIWLEGPSQLLQFTGILALGVGDALASIVGKRIGTHRWCQGSVAFTVSVVGCAWILRLCGFAEAFSTTRYSMVVVVSSVLEALSDQNDNLTLPLYMWSMLALADV